VNDPAAFTSIVETARKALETSKEPTAARQVPRI
jgi:hypothetical protein